MRILITGAYGFIGSHLTAKLLKQGHDVHILDSQTYAANPAGLRKLIGDGRLLKAYHFDLRDAEIIDEVIKQGQFEQIYHLAAESHVCNSIKGPKQFYETNVMGTVNLFESVRKHSPNSRVVHVSTDEVFGDLIHKQEEAFSETSLVEPRSPYSSSKAASDHVAMAYAHTYGLNVSVTNCSNNYGPNQHIEKLIPATINRLLQGEPIRLYGNGSQIRDWLYVGDHCDALQVVAEKGSAGERYCIGGDCALSNKKLVYQIAKIMDNQGLFKLKNLEYVYTDDRPTDDQVYIVNNSKIKDLGWKPSINLLHINHTIDWYYYENH